MSATVSREIKDVVLIGAGHAHVGLLARYALQPFSGARLTLLTRQPYTFYSGMLPGVIAGHYAPDQARIDVSALAGRAGARFFQGEVAGLDVVRQRIICSDRAPVSYDVVSINTGSAVRLPLAAASGRRAIAVKPIDEFLDSFARARDRVLARRRHARIGVIGGGAGGVELALAMQHRLAFDAREAGRGSGALSVVVITDTPEILSSFPPATRQVLDRLLRAHGIEVRVNAKVTAVEDDAVIVNGGERIALDEVVWVTGAQPPSWLETCGLELDEQGFIRVAPTLQSVSHPNVLAAGDIASITGYELPKSGVYAVRSGKPLAINIRNLLAGAPLTSYRPQRQALYLISTGAKYAVGTRNGLTFKGAWVWRLKDRIDRRFMAKFLPSQPAASASSASAVK